jgi:hypothetical protein
MLGARRSIEEEFGQGHNGAVFRVQENIPDLIGNGAAARLPGYRQPQAAFFQSAGQELQLGGFAAPFYPFECDETGHEAAP